MKKIIIIMLAILSIAGISKAQTRLKITSNTQQGQYIDFGGVNLIPSDSLQVTDTLAYIVPITHLNNIDFYHSFYWQKIGSGTATLKIVYLAGNDPTNFFTIKAGKAQAPYVKTLTLSASGWYDINSVLDTAVVSGRYLKLQFITSGTASVKGKIFNRLKTNIK